MPDPANKAVFLSYASQDAEAARRICGALRAAGAEVWFDQSELVGGDAWDAKIRRQIRDCTLFIPLISAGTQARREAYFRLEWNLAAQRTHMMAAGTPFILPVVIDATGDAEALVPDEFRGVQWTRLPEGEVAAAFAERVKLLCDKPAAMQPGRPVPPLPAARPFIFSGRSYADPAHLAADLVPNWVEGLRRWKDGSILEWTGDNIPDEALAHRLREIAQAAQMEPEQQLAVALLALNPTLPLAWQGEIVTDAWLAAHAEAAGRLCDSAIPAWVKRLRGDDWLVAKAARRKAILREMPVTTLAVDRARVEALIFGPVAAIEEQVGALAGQFSGSTDPAIGQLLAREELSVGEAVLLLAVPRNTFLSATASAPLPGADPGAEADPGANAADAGPGRFVELCSLRGHAAPVTGVAFSAGVRWLASGGNDARIIAWDPRTAEAARQMAGVAAAVGCVLFNPDGHTLASGGADGAVRLWEVNIGRELRRLDGHHGLVTSLAFTSNGRQLASGSMDKTVLLWDVWMGKEIRRLSGHLDWVSGVAFSPDGGRIATSGADHSIRVWETGTGRQLWSADRHGAAVHGVAFSPDGRLIASAGADNSIRLWDARNGAEVRQFDGHTRAVLTVVFSPGGRWLASGGKDNVVRLWEVESGRELQRLEGHSDAVRCVTFSPDGRWLASGAADHSIRVWNLLSD